MTTDATPTLNIPIELVNALQSITDCARTIESFLEKAHEEFPELELRTPLVLLDTFSTDLEGLLEEIEEMSAATSDKGATLEDHLYSTVSQAIESFTGEKRAFTLHVELLPTKIH